MIILNSRNCAIDAAPESKAIKLAVKDLERDLHKVLGSPKEHLQTAAVIRISIDADLANETWRIDVDQTIHIRGGNELGTIYGIYAFSHRVLGVDPMWFWKGIEPHAREEIEVPTAEWSCAPPVFKLRGWFINDEDLLGRWKDSGLKRFQDWPEKSRLEAIPDEYDYEKRLLKYYTPIVSPEVMEAVFEAVLRMGCNMIIPASFIDIMNPDEAAIIEAAVKRGLFVSQHHVEPLGVSHFAYETWCAKQRLEGPHFSYRESPEAMQACWLAYAQRWWEIAGEHIVWQVGLRGRGDRPLWHHDPEARTRAGEFITEALKDQLSIIQSVDSRPKPPATLTLWLEGAELIQSGDLSIPDAVIIVFADDDLTQQMRQDFHSLPRRKHGGYGFYYHVAVWCFGPHLVQGLSPQKIAGTIQEVVEKGDTDYAILNVANVREHVLGASLWSQQVWHPDSAAAEQFLDQWAPKGSAAHYKALFEALPELRPEWRLYDSSARTFIHDLLKHFIQEAPLSGLVEEVITTKREQTQKQISKAAACLNHLLQTAEKLHFDDPAEAAFFKTNYITQVSILHGLYRALYALLLPEPDFTTANASIIAAQQACKLAEYGHWAHWYRGDNKVGLADLSKRIEIAQTQPRNP